MPALPARCPACLLPGLPACPACCTGGLLKDGTCLDADLVVDASGHSSHATDWLAAAGREAPPFLFVDGKLAYASRFYRPRKGYSGMRGVGACAAASPRASASRLVPANIPAPLPLPLLLLLAPPPPPPPPAPFVTAAACRHWWGGGRPPPALR
jgi:hypothetical protein